jgi:hypothetical protein
LGQEAVKKSNFSSLQMIENVSPGAKDRLWGIYSQNCLNHKLVFSQKLDFLHSFQTGRSPSFAV